MAKLILFKGKDFDGNAFVTGGSIFALKDIGFDNTIDSLIVIEGTWKLYQDAQHEGKSATVSADQGPFADGTYADRNDWGGPKNKISSIELIS